MPSVSPIARFIVENKLKAHKMINGCVELKNADNKILGRITKGEAPLGQYRYINIDLYNPENEELFMGKRTVIEKTYRYFLKEHRFMPVKIEIENTIYDFEHNTKKKDTLTRGLCSDLYTEQLKESDELKAERKKIGTNVPSDFPIYEINKPFKYEFKAHLYYTTRPIDSSKPMLKE